MNPLMLRLLGTLVRWLITAAGATAYFSENDIAQLVGILVALGTLGWSAYEKYRSQKVTNTALAMPKASTLEEAKDVAKSLAAPPATLAADAVAVLKVTR